MTAWLIARAGLSTDGVRPPDCGRAPGWHAGLELARRASLGWVVLPRRPAVATDGRPLAPWEADPNTRARPTPRRPPPTSLRHEIEDPMRHAATVEPTSDTVRAHVPTEERGAQLHTDERILDRRAGRRDLGDRLRQRRLLPQVGRRTRGRRPAPRILHPDDVLVSQAAGPPAAPHRPAGLPPRLRARPLRHRGLRPRDAQPPGAARRRRAPARRLVPGGVRRRRAPWMGHRV